ncbi:hypothetical protein OL239_09055 [Arthrobacter sp. ATA002]|uniref:hypothetical protein n=1 Tax=Arthrobacter sp. ATA002 TaxID=2991715 RepID=UPI0022A74F6B|nr:hypothetical protein [Arthrobacter sp. ATA002]WAP53176.1 hypothetical protein OL239_09055 [Arthrobacter sp. ATA002]
MAAGAGVLSKFLPRTGARLPMTWVLEALPGLILLGFGMATIFVPLQDVALAGIGGHDAGVASAAVHALR